MHILKQFCLLLILALLSLPVAAQNLGGIDFSQLKADDLSNQQIIQLYEQMQERGMTISEVEAIAIARGTPPSEVSKLRDRLNEIRSMRLTDEGGTAGDNRLRNEVTDRQTGDKKSQASTDTLGLLLGTEKRIADSMRVFGSTIFANQRITFEPSINIATPSNYVLGPGDEVIVDIWGASENNYQLTVSPEGSVHIANVGPIHVSGLTIEEAANRLTERLSAIYSGLKGQNPNTFIQVTLGDIRSIKVNIVGEVTAPGTYTLSSLATVFNALYAAGGPDQNGTYRAIQVLRANAPGIEVDLYDFLVGGDLSGNVALQDQDIIKIDPYVNRVRVEGEFKRTGLFETLEGETVADLIRYTGGFTQNAYSRRITIERNTPAEKRIVDVLYPEQDTTALKSGDIVRVGKVLDRFENKVSIEGAVFRPGDYQLENSPTLLALIENASGLMGDAFLERAIIYRTRPNYTIEAISVNLANLLENPENDVELVKDDLVQISSIFELQAYQTVQISGSVNAPGAYPFTEDLSLKDLILEADGLADEASPYRIEVARRIRDRSGEIRNEIAEVFSVDIESGLQFNEDMEDLILQPYDQVFVRKSPAYVTQKTVRIEGEVMYPGTYVLSRRDFRLSDLIEVSGGLTPYAFTEGASMTREFNRFIENLDLNLADTVAGRQVESLNKVGIDLNLALQKPDSYHDILLFEGDVIEVPRRLETVQIRGEVLYPVNTRYIEGRSFRNYIASAGGFTEEANTNRAYIVYANGEVDRTRKFLLFKSYPEVRPGSVLIIPPKKEQERLTTAERITVMSTIVSLAAIVTNTIFQIRNSK